MASASQQVLLMFGGVGGGGTGGAEATAFLARTSGLDATHTNAYITLINGLVSDGIWSKLDVLRIYATQDSTTALLNLCSASFTGTVHGAPTFTADSGYTGVDLSTTVWIDSGFNPSTAGGQYTQNSAHLSAWIIDNTGATQPAFGYANAGSTSVAYAWSRFTTDNLAYSRINSTGVAGDGQTPGGFTGHFIGNRSGAAAHQQYRNGSSIGADIKASTALNNLKFYELGINNNGTADGAGNKYAMISIGSSLSAGEVTLFYNHLRTYMTTVGVS